MCLCYYLANPLPIFLNYPLKARVIVHCKDFIITPMSVKDYLNFHYQRQCSRLFISGLHKSSLQQVNEIAEVIIQTSNYSQVTIAGVVAVGLRQRYVLLTLITLSMQSHVIVCYIQDSPCDVQVNPLSQSKINYLYPDEVALGLKLVGHLLNL